MSLNGNNPTIYNAALAAYFAAAATVKGPLPVAAASNTALEANAIAFATEVDAGITQNANISAGGAGTATTAAPIAGVTTASQLALSHITFGLCFEQAKGAFVLGAVAANYASLAAAILSVYTAFVAATTTAGSLI